ncbi:hypothetical protein ACIQW7_24315 [Peribacillus simplex]|uniref:hypothetical protein n=1 Tax=Peribacillus simplex TaxID=1478 RepID=UPI00381CA6F4
MKKTLIFMIFLVSILAGCNNGDKYINLSGESDHWKGEYVATATEDTENGTYKFKYKNANSDSDVTFKKLQVLIDDATEQNETNHEGPIIEIPTACSGCSVTNESIPKNVTIKWDGNTETFSLKKSK